MGGWFKSAGLNFERQGKKTYKNNYIKYTFKDVFYDFKQGLQEGLQIWSFSLKTLACKEL